MYEFTTQVQHDLIERFSTSETWHWKHTTSIDIVFTRKQPLIRWSENKFCLVLNPKLVEDNDAKPNIARMWLLLHQRKQVLIKFIYFVQKVVTT